MSYTRGKKFIYDVKLANRFIQCGCRCIETGYNKKSNKFFWAFNYNDVQPYYENK